MLVTVVADYGIGDLAFAEVRQRFAVLLPDAVVAAIPVPPFDTVSAGFCIAQLAFGEGPAATAATGGLHRRRRQPKTRAGGAARRDRRPGPRADRRRRGGGRGQRRR